MDDSGEHHAFEDCKQVTFVWELHQITHCSMSAHTIRIASIKSSSMTPRFGIAKEALHSPDKLILWDIACLSRVSWAQCREAGGLTMKIPLYHSTDPSAPEVHHDRDDCPYGKLIPTNNKANGAGGNPRCKTCISMD